MTLARCAAVAIFLWAGEAGAFAQEASVEAASPKVQKAKKAQKKSPETPVKEKAPSEAPAALPPPNAAEGVAPVQAPSRPAREEKPGKAPLATLPPPDTATPPPRLPEASREKMRACAIEWSKLKLEARNPMPLWRDFGSKCLTR